MLVNETSESLSCTIQGSKSFEATGILIITKVTEEFLLTPMEGRGCFFDQAERKSRMGLVLILMVWNRVLFSRNWEFGEITYWLSNFSLYYK